MPKSADYDKAAAACERQASISRTKADALDRAGRTRAADREYNTANNSQASASNLRRRAEDERGR